MDGAPAGDVARPAAEDAPSIQVAFRGVDDLEEVDLGGGHGQAVATGSPDLPDDEARSSEVREDVCQEPDRDIHPLRDPGGAEHAAERLPAERNHRPHRVVAASRERHSHASIIHRAQ